MNTPLKPKVLLGLAWLVVSTATLADTAGAPAPRPTPQKAFGNPKSCPKFTIPAVVRQFAALATSAEASASGLATGQYGGVKPIGEGGVCTGLVYKITRPGLKLWRVASTSALRRNAREGHLGGWWSFTKSDDRYTTRASWRRDNAVCRDWNPEGDLIFSCTLTKGEFILVGPGQSAHCDKLNAGGVDKTRYPASSTVQVYWQGWRKSSPKTKGCGGPQRIKRWTEVEGRGGTRPPPATTGAKP